MVRLKAELAVAEQAWRTIATDFEARKPRSSHFWTILLVLSVLGSLVGFVWSVSAGVQKNWSGVAVGIIILALSVVGGWQGADRGTRFAAPRGTRPRELWGPPPPPPRRLQA